MPRGALRPLLQLLLLCSAAAFSAGVACRRGGAARAPIAMQEERRFEVCQGRYCSKKGAKRTLALFEELGADVPGVLVEVADMGHTDHGCFDECTMGRESRIFEPLPLALALQTSSAEFRLGFCRSQCARRRQRASHGRREDHQRRQGRGQGGGPARSRPTNRGVRCEPPPDGAPGPRRELHCRPPGLGGSCTADPQPARLPVLLHHADCTFPRLPIRTFPRLPILAQPPSCPTLVHTVYARRRPATATRATHTLLLRSLVRV